MEPPRKYRAAQLACPQRDAALYDEVLKLLGLILEIANVLVRGFEDLAELHLLLQRLLGRFTLHALQLFREHIN